MICSFLKIRLFFYDLLTRKGFHFVHLSLPSGRISGESPQNGLKKDVSNESKKRKKKLGKGKMFRIFGKI